jgi:hypothetical protein
MKAPVCNLDLLDNLASHREDFDEMLAKLSSVSTIVSAQHDQLFIQHKPWDDFRDDLIEYAAGRCSVPHKHIDTVKSLGNFTDTVKSLVDVVMNAQGGCTFVVTTSEGYKHLQDIDVEFQAVDKCDQFPEGYMTHRLRNVNASSSDFLEAIQEFTAHTVDDRWPAGHVVAAGLHKDGYHLMGTEGFRKKCAARIIGLPAAPRAWKQCGCRHMTALALTWSLRRFPCVVIIRSESGRVTGLCSNGDDGVIASRVDAPLLLEAFRKDAADTDDALELDALELMSSNGDGGVASCEVEYNI